LVVRRRRLVWALVSVGTLAAGLVAAFLLARPAVPTIELAPLVSDGMVLQRDTVVTLTGRARPSWPVVVSGSWGHAATTRADAQGAWRARLRTTGAGGPYRMIVWSGDTRVVGDVWIGETWLCSGQSNMAITFRTAHPAETADVPPLPPIQLFNVGLAIADSPQKTCAGKWTPAKPDTVAGFSAACWHFGRALHDALGVPVGLVAAAASGIDIEGWTSERGLLEVPEMAAEVETRRRLQTGVTVAGGWRPGLFFNAMIAPLAPYTLRGVVWYQGEANISRAAQYARLFPAMIRDWRTWFEQDLPFGFVQLPAFSGYPWKGALAELRDAQRRTLAVPNTHMIVTLDIANPRDIHSVDKAVVGRRLADWALASLYGRTDRPASGPLFRSVQFGPAGARVFFDHADGGLVAATSPLTGFELAGEDRKFHPAWSVVENGKAVLVRSAQVPHPVAVRYAWSDAPNSSLKNQAGLPASPFRSDNWPGVTDQATWQSSLQAHSATADPDATADPRAPAP
jgi:sialate O-acetylesterase